jgi:hypothetical protein
MELSKKTTILFPPELHNRLARLAVERQTSIGELVRSACIKQYGCYSKEDRLGALAELTSLNLPVGDPAQLERESMPPVDELIP